LTLSSHILAPGADATAPEPAVTTPYTALVSAVSAATTNCSVTVGGGGGTGAVAYDTLVVYYVAEAGRFADATKAVLHALFAWLPADVSPATLDASALTVLVHLLSRVEGPLYKAVRGGGLAYDASLTFDAGRGRLVAGVSEAKAPATAWSALATALAKVRAHLAAGGGDREREMDTARAAAVYAAVECRCAASLVESAALRRSGLRLPACDASAQEARLAVVSRADCVRVLDAYLHPLLLGGSGGGGGGDGGGGGRAVGVPPSTVVLVAIVAP